MPSETTIVVPPGKKKERLDLFLVHHIENATRNRIQRGIKQGLVLVDGRPARASHLVGPGEVIQVTLPKPPPQKATPENIPLNILFEDDHLLVVNKPAGMVTHPAHGNYTGTLVNALLHHCRMLSEINNDMRPGIVHRLDKDTSGLLVVAKTDVVHAALAKQFAARTVDREYRAIVWGKFRRRAGSIEADLGRSRSDRKKIAVVEGGRHALTTYQVLEQFSYLALVSLRLLTGRTHQIRVHLSHIHHPVLGDPTYGGRRIVYGPHTPKQKTEVQHLLELMPRQALHARTLGFIHPATKEKLMFASDPPDDMAMVLTMLRAKR